MSVFDISRTRLCAAGVVIFSLLPRAQAWEVSNKTTIDPTSIDQRRKWSRQGVLNSVEAFPSAQNETANVAAARPSNDELEKLTGMLVQFQVFLPSTVCLCNSGFPSIHV